MPTFSERYGYKPVRTQLQFEEMDDDLRNSLWNCITDFPLETGYFDEDFGDYWYDKKFIKAIFTEFFKIRYSPLGMSWINHLELIQDKFMRLKWNKVYDFLEFIICYKREKQTILDLLEGLSDSERIDYFEDALTKVLKREVSAYRIVNNRFSPIVSESEVDSIENAIQDAHEQGLKNVTTHLQSALSLLSDRTEPDYRNSIKESISAVEAIAQRITDKPNATLGDCLKAIDDKLPMHGALKKGLDKLYGYTSDADGIRHALMEETNLDLEDARFMLVSCSAFINYLIVKADKAGIKFD